MLERSRLLRGISSARLLSDVPLHQGLQCDLQDASQTDSLKKLPSSATHLSGKFAIKLRGRDLDLTRTISPSSALPGAGFLPASKFAGHRLSYIIHLPLAAKQSNATRTEDDGKTLIWDSPLDWAIKQPITTHFIAPIPVPSWLISAIIIVFVIILVIGILILRKFKKRVPLKAAMDSLR